MKIVDIYFTFHFNLDEKKTFNQNVKLQIHKTFYLKILKVKEKYKDMFNSVTGYAFKTHHKLYLKCEIKTNI